MKDKDADTVRTYAAPSSEWEVDAIGLQCPLPVLKLQKALRNAAQGSRIRLLATDPASQIDVPHFCNETGHHLREHTQDSDVFCYVVECATSPDDDFGG